MFDALNDILAEPWFWPAAAVIVGLPIVLLVLGELHTELVRRDSPGARIVLLIRNVLAPLGAIIILFTQIPQDAGSTDFTWAKVAATLAQVNDVSPGACGICVKRMMIAASGASTLRIISTMF